MTVTVTLTQVLAGGGLVFLAGFGIGLCIGAYKEARTFRRAAEDGLQCQRKG